jgi:transposase
VPVKASGGRPYPRAKHLSRPAPQKTRGFFSRFSCSEFNTGRVHGAFDPSQDATAVCAFLRRVRHGYPQRPVRVVLDRDGAHPWKAKRTRHVMRKLGVAWTTLPKRSPDDNPVEGLFRDVEQRVLDSRDDADEPTTQHRISGHLQAGNRRGRRMRVHDLPDSPKHEVTNSAKDYVTPRLTRPAAAPRDIG